MNARIHRRIAVAGVMLGLLLLAVAAPPALAQTSTESSAVDRPEAAAAPKREPVAPSEIAKTATESITRSRELVRASAPDITIERIAEELPATIAKVERLGLAPVNRDMDNAAPKLLNEARQQWENVENNLGGWSRSLERRSRDIQNVRNELQELQESWRLTAADSSFAPLPEAVKVQVRTVRSHLTDADKVVRQRQEYVLTLQNQVSEQLIAVAEAIDRLNSAMAARQDDLLDAVMPPLWTPVRDDQGSLGLKRDLVSTGQRVVDGIVELRSGFLGTLRLHFVAFVLLAVGMWLLARRVVLDEDADDRIRVALSILRKPIAASGLLVILLFSPLYKSTPVVVQSMFPVVAIPFAAWLTPAFIPAARRRLVYGMLLLSMITNLQAVIVAVGALRQFVLVLIPVVGLIGLAIVRRRINREDPVIWPGISRTVLVAGTLAMTGILGAGALGYVPLGEHLASATIEAAYLAFVLLAGYRIVDALIVLALRTQVMQRLNVVRNSAEGIRGFILAFTRLTAGLLWLWNLLDRLLFQDAVSAAVSTWLDAVWEIGSLRISLGSLLLFSLVLWLTLLIARIVRHLLQDDILPRAEMPRGRSAAVSMLVNYGIVGLGFMAALAAAGVRIEQFALVGGALGIGIGFGLQNIVGNFVSGLILVFERPVQVGDTVEVGTLLGTVRRIGVRSSTVRTFDEAEVIIPNSDLISSHVVNWTKSDQLRRMEIKVGVAYGTDPIRVQEILVAQSAAHAKVLDYPAPYALFKGFGDSSLDFVVRFWTSDYGNWIFIASEVTVSINSALNEAGITIPFPQRDLHIYSVDPPAPIPDGGRVALPTEPPSDTSKPADQPPQMDGDE